MLRPLGHQPSALVFRRPPLPGGYGRAEGDHGPGGAAFNPTLRERFAKHPETIAQTQNFLATLGGAPVCVLAFFRKNDYPDRDGAMQSVAAAIENILLAAWDKGIGSCWISAPLKVGMGEELRQRFAPDKGEFVAAITLGYPDETPRCPIRRGGQFDLR